MAAGSLRRLKDDQPIVADDHFEVLEDREHETYTLRVNDTATDDHGVYTVTARNSQGDASKSAQLSLHSEWSSVEAVPVFAFLLLLGARGHQN